MKVEQQKTFTPVTITLETQEEVDMLVSLIGRIDARGEIRENLINPLFDMLQAYGDYNKYTTSYRSNT